MPGPVVRAVLSVLQRAGMATADETADVERTDKLIMELQREVGKLGGLVSKPPKDGRIPTNKKPNELQRPGTPVNPGWAITPFGHLCLAYLEGDEVDISASEAMGLSDERFAGRPDRNDQEDLSEPS